MSSLFVLFVSSKSVLFLKTIFVCYAVFNECPRGGGGGGEGWGKRGGWRYFCVKINVLDSSSLYSNVLSSEFIRAKL